MFVSEYENYELCHGPRDQNIYHFQSAQEGPHPEQPDVSNN